MYFVYILLSSKDNKTYTGYTNNIVRRLQEHNSGNVKATMYRTPFKVLHLEEFETEKEAKHRELWWKSSTGRKKLKEIYKNRPNL